MESSALYQDYSLTAYRNSLELLEEAHLLNKAKRYARSYALAILAAEEFAKAYLCKCVAVEIITDKDFDRQIVNHRLKQFHFIHILAFQVFFQKNRVAILDAMRIDAATRDHSKHIFLKVLAEAISDKSSFELVVKLFKDSEELKQQAFYSDLLSGKVRRPSELVTERVAKTILDYLAVIYGFEEMLKLGGEKFRSLVELIDPEPLSGSAWPSIYKRKTYRYAGIT